MENDFEGSGQLANNNQGKVSLLTTVESVLQAIEVHRKCLVGSSQWKVYLQTVNGHSFDRSVAAYNGHTKVSCRQ